MNHTDPDGAPNVRADAYLVAHTVAPCQQCGLPTGLVGIGLTRGHQRCIDDAWAPVDSAAWLFQVGRIPADVVSSIQGLSPHFRLSVGDDAWSGYWLNHCRHCGVPQDDYWLYCEPGAGFLAGLDGPAAPIDLVEIRAPFCARADGFAELPGN